MEVPRGFAAQPAVGLTSPLPRTPLTPASIPACRRHQPTCVRAGRIVILVDEEDRENEGDLVLAADHHPKSAHQLSMARFGRGPICLTLTRERCEFLEAAPMAARNGTVYSTAFTMSPSKQPKA